MKKLFIILAFCLISKGLRAQGNLQFNQLLTYTGELTGAVTLSPTYTVPPGKLWKLEYLTETRIITGSTGNPFFGAYINGKAQMIEKGSSPIWLKAGDTIYYRNFGLGQYGTDGWAIPMQTYLMSIIEYNIIP